MRVCIIFIFSSLFHSAVAICAPLSKIQYDLSTVRSTNPIDDPAVNISNSQYKHDTNLILTIDKIKVITHPIFDETDPDSFFIHRWANFLHINTRDTLVLNRLHFKQGDTITGGDIEEGQRNLRSAPFIRDAKISYQDITEPAQSSEISANRSKTDSVPKKRLVVETWDNWSLLPTFSLSQSGGEQKFSIGIKEDNLFGYGISTNLNYTSNADRTGYKLGIETPLDDLIRYSNIAFNLQNNSDGQVKRISFWKPFQTLNAQQSYAASYNDERRNDTVRQNGNDIDQFQHKIDFTQLHYGWKVSQQDNTRHRLITGITQDKHSFAPLEEYPDTTLPQDRDFIYPWLAYEYIEDNFEVFNNIFFINYNEDINLGWRHYFQLGFETNDLTSDQAIGYHLNWQTQKGFSTLNQLLLFNFYGNSTLATTQDDHYRINLNAQYFYRINSRWTAYSRIRLSSSQNNYLDKTFALGDNTGVRGYPNDYQHGDHQWVVSAELRNYPNIQLYQLAELGWALFSDVGQAFGGTDTENAITSPIGSIGVGVRIYSSHSSYGNVAHIDFTVPYTSGENINSWEWRFQIRKHF